MINVVYVVTMATILPKYWSYRSVVHPSAGILGNAFLNPVALNLTGGALPSQMSVA